MHWRTVICNHPGARLPLVTTGLFLRFFGAVACTVALALPAHAAGSASLEDSFDSAFTAKNAAMAPPRAANPNVIPLIAMAQPRSAYASPFEANLAALADGTQGRIGVAALDLATGRVVAVLGNQPFPMASTSKIAIVATYLAMVDAGTRRLDQSLALRVPVPSKKFDGSEAPVRAGASLMAIDLIEATITRSDNQATDALLAAVGGPAAVTRWVQQATGITEFRLDRTIATLVRDDGAFDPATMIDARDSVTPVAMVRLLSGLYEGRWLSPQSRDLLIGSMSRTVTGKRRIRAGLPEDAQVAHKTGTLSNTSSDVGFVRGPDGRDFALAIYVTGQGGKAGRDARIAAIARAIYEGYQSDSPRQNRAALR